MLSVARVQAYLGVTGDSDYLTELERGAVADVQELTGRFLGTSTAFVDVRDVPASRERLTLPEGPQRYQSVLLSQPAALAGITVAERSSPVEAWVTVDHETDDVVPLEVFELRGRRLYRMIGSWPAGRSTVRCSYSFGYAVDAAPAEFNAVTLDLIAARYRSAAMRSLGGGVQSASVRGASVSLASGSAGEGMPQELLRRILALRDTGSL